MSDKSTYYGGYALHRGGGNNSAAPARTTPTFHNDWNMMMPNTPAQQQQQQAQQQRGGVFPNMLRNFFMPMPMYGGATPTAAPAPQPSNNNNNFYKGAPLTRNGPAPAHDNTHKATGQNNKTAPATTTTAKSRTPVTSKVLRQSSDTWGAFDGLAPLPQARAVDPIGTPLPRSVWADTPADASKGPKSFALWGNGINNQGSLWKPPSLQRWMTGALQDSDDEIDPALLDKATKQSMMQWTTEATTGDDASIQAMLTALTAPEPTPAPAPICDTPTMALRSNTADSDDEWMDHFQESVDRAMRQPSLDVAALVAQSQQPKPTKVDKEWALHQVPQGL